MEYSENVRDRYRDVGKSSPPAQPTPSRPVLVDPEIEGWELPVTPATAPVVVAPAPPFGTTKPGDDSPASRVLRASNVYANALTQHAKAKDQVASLRKMLTDATEIEKRADTLQAEARQELAELVSSHTGPAAQRKDS